jgi:hypothetical protein
MRSRREQASGWPKVLAMRGKAEGVKTSSVKPAIFVTVPVNNFGKWAFSTIGLDYPDWKILEN